MKWNVLRIGANIQGDLSLIPIIIRDWRRTGFYWILIGGCDSFSTYCIWLGFESVWIIIVYLSLIANYYSNSSLNRIIANWELRNANLLVDSAYYGNYLLMFFFLFFFQKFEWKPYPLFHKFKFIMKPLHICGRLLCFPNSLHIFKHENILNSLSFFYASGFELRKLILNANISSILYTCT